MDITEYLITMVMEECAEITQAASKGLRFGLDDGYPGSERTNRDDLVKEVNDLLGVLQLLEEYGVDLPGIGDQGQVADKKRRIKEYLKYSQQQGCLFMAQKNDAE